MDFTEHVYMFAALFSEGLQNDHSPGSCHELLVES